MMGKTSTATANKTMIIITIIVLLLPALPEHFAWGMRSLTRQNQDDICLFSIQLKEDPQIRSRYESMVIAANEQIAPKFQSVEEMYADTSKASIEEDDGGFLATFSKKNSRPIGGPQDVDNLTAICLGCHDGETAQDISVDLRNDPYSRNNRFSGGKYDHPIGMDYNQYVSSGKGYKPITDSRMIFVNGRVGCLTCHDPFNQEKGHLVLSERQGALCLTCHNK